MSKRTVRLTESDLHNIIKESVKNIFKEDHQNLPIQNIVDYLNKELNYLEVSYDSKKDELTIYSKERLGLSDASIDNYLSSYFEKLAKEFKIIEKYTMGTIGFEVDGTNYDKETKNVQNMTLTDSNIYGTVAMDKDGGLEVLFKAKGHSNVYFWGSKLNQYDKTNYLNGKWIKPNNEMDWKDKLEYDKDAAIDKRDPRKRFKEKLDNIWKRQQEHEKYSQQADSRPLHRKGSLNRELMAMDRENKQK